MKSLQKCFKVFVINNNKWELFGVFTTLKQVKEYKEVLGFLWLDDRVRVVQTY